MDIGLQVAQAWDPKRGKQRREPAMSQPPVWSEIPACRMGQRDLGGEDWGAEAAGVCRAVTERRGLHRVWETWKYSAETRKAHLPGARGAMLGAHMGPGIVMLLPDREENLVIHEDKILSSKKTS